jgi:hypothetical protein
MLWYKFKAINYLLHSMCLVRYHFIVRLGQGLLCSVVGLFYFSFNMFGFFFYSTFWRSSINYVQLSCTFLLFRPPVLCPLFFCLDISVIMLCVRYFSVIVNLEYLISPQNEMRKCVNHFLNVHFDNSWDREVRIRRI